MLGDEALLDQLLAEEGLELDATVARIAHVPTPRRQKRYGPLSFAQQRLYFLDDILEDKSAYHIVYCAHFSSALEVDKLKRAFRSLSQRHASLRTRFSLVPGHHNNEEEPGQALQSAHTHAAIGHGLAQEVLPQVELNWQEEFLPVANIDAFRALGFNALAPGAAVAKLNAYSRQTLSLDTAPLSRQCLYTLEDGSYVLQWVLHHIISDGLSRDILVADLVQLYLQNSGQSNAEAVIDFVDYARWQRGDQQTDKFAAQLAFWRKQLSPLADPLELPADRPRQPQVAVRGGVVEVAVGKEQVKALRDLARCLKTTPFVVLLASFQSLLSRVSNQKRFFVGAPVANRENPDVQNLVGPLLNTLVLTADFSRPISFERLVTELHEQLGQALENQAVPFELVVDELLEDRDGATAPLVQTLFSLQTAGASQAIFGDVIVEQFVLSTHTSKLDFSLHLFDFSEGETDFGIRGVFEYAVELFDVASIQRLAGTWQKLLSAVLATPEKPVQKLGLLSAEDIRDQANWMGRRLEYAAQNLLQIFDRSLLATPNAVAVADGQTQLSYADLDRKSTCLAQEIRRRLPIDAAAQDTLVAILLPRTSDLLVAILSVFKAGCGYVPLDPGYPAKRNQHIWEDSKAQLMLSESSVLDRAAFIVATPLLLDEFDFSSVAIDRKVSAPLLLPATLAYVIYTSGSTGHPKGVMVEQGNAVALIEWAKTLYSSQQCSGVLFSTSVCFDLSIFEIFLPLSCGGCVLIAENALAVPELEQRISAAGTLPAISLINTVPSAIRVLCREQLIPPTVTTINLAGELLPQALVDELYAMPNVEHVYDLYGPSEDTTYSTYARRLPGGIQNIGRPIANTQAYVLDSYLNRQPVGAIGELYLGGLGLARGYLHQPRLTAEKFIANPFKEDLLDPRPPRSNRLYRTGDLVKQRETGDLVYLGRVDDQVKLRGHRIELGEVDRALLDLPQVGDAIAVIQTSEQGVQQLTAYVVKESASGSAPEQTWTATLQTQLAKVLPDYMVPTVWLSLAELPLLPNGKVDRESLPPPRVLACDNAVAPSTALEKSLAEIWQQLLALDPGVVEFNIDATFFSLGGDSIMSLQLAGRVQQLGYPMQARDLFRYHTVRLLAAYLETLDDAADVVDRFALRPALVKADQARLSGKCSPLPMHQWFVKQNFSEQHFWHQTLVFELKESLDAELLRAALEAVYQHHDGLRLTLDADACLQFGVQNVVLDSVYCADRNDAASELNRWQSGWSLKRGPLLKAALVVVQNRPVLFALAAHHLLIDGVSWRIFLEDLHTAYGQSLQGVEVSLGPKSVSIRQWQQGLAQAATMLPAQPLPCPPPLVLPFDRAEELGCPAVVREATRVEHLETMGRDFTRVLLSVNHAAFNTEIQDLLCTALYSCLSNWLQQQAIAFTLEGHGRESLGELTGQEYDLSRTIAWCTSLYPLVLDIPGHSTSLERLKLVKESRRALLLNGVEYGIRRFFGLAEHSDQALVASDLALPPVVFNYFGQVDNSIASSPWFSAADLPGLKVHGDANELPFAITVNSAIREGALQLSWGYSYQHFAAETIARLAREFTTELQLVVDELTDAEPAFTPADVPGTALVQSQLDAAVFSKAKFCAVYPLTGLQEGLVFQSRLDRAKGDYIQQFHCRLQGNLDHDDFLASWQALIDRYSVLRTSFALGSDGKVVQRVHRSVPLTLPIETLATLDEAAKADVFKQEQHSLEVIAGRPPMSWRLLRCQQSGDYCFIWTFHHALLDGWSLPVLLAEFADNYRAVTQGLPLPQRAQPLQYSDFVRENLRVATHAKAKAFWAQFLAGYEEPVSLLPLLGPSATGLDKSADKPVYKNHFCRWSAGDSDRARALCRDSGVTLNTLTQGMWALVQHMLCSAEDLLYGVTSSGRTLTLPGIDTAVGLYINSLPMRTHFDAAAPVIDWLEGVQQRQSESLVFEQTTLLDIHASSSLGPGTVLFDSLFIFENYPIDDTLFTETNTDNELGLSFSNAKVLEQAHYPLTLYVHDGGELTVRFSFNPAVVSEGKVASIAQMLHFLLLQVVDNPRMFLSDLRLSVPTWPATWRQWNDTAAAYTSAAINQQFLVAAGNYSATPALVCGEASLNYEQLANKTLKLATYLQSQGIKEGDVVGCCLPRGENLIVSLLSIWHIGACYLPLDPGYPEDRLAFMIKDSQAVCVLTESTVSNSAIVAPSARVGPVEEHGQYRTISLDLCNEAVDRTEADSEKPLSGNVSQAASLAYLIYTSGSTGVPKGVMVSHLAIANFLHAMNQQLQLNSGDRWLAITSISFDIAVLEIFLPLVTGATVVLADERQANDGRQLLALLEEQQIKYMQATPATWRLMMAAAWSVLDEKDRDVADGIDAAEHIRHCYRLPVALCGGEVMPVDLASALLPRCQQLWNVYGPTETTVWSTVHKVHEKDLAGPISIGKPISNTQAQVVNAFGQSLPVGFPGELWLSGDGVSLGYWLREELTAERFVERRFADGAESVARYYRTGDLVRWTGDGELDCLGRLDDQVKIRGHRVELGEIETCLLRHTHVAQIIVRAVPDHTARLGIAAYYKRVQTAGNIDRPVDAEDINAIHGVAGAAINPMELKQFCQQYLPDYMVPQWFVAIEEWPLTPSGKINKHALPAPMTGLADRRTSKPLASVTEEQLAALWREVLKLEVGQPLYADDDFFQLGGHSLQLAQLAYRIEARWPIFMPLEKLAMTTEIAVLAEAIDVLLLVAAVSADVNQAPTTASNAISSAELNKAVEQGEAVHFEL